MSFLLEFAALGPNAPRRRRSAGAWQRRCAGCDGEPGHPIVQGVADDPVADQVLDRAAVDMALSRVEWSVAVR